MTTLSLERCKFQERQVNARAAFETGDWSRYTGAQRAACMNKLANSLVTKAPDEYHRDQFGL